MVRNINDAAVKDVQIKWSKEGYASDMGQRSYDAVAKDAKIEL